MALLTRVSDARGRARIRVLLDQPRGRLIVLSKLGQPIAEVNATDPKAKPSSGIYLENKRGSVRIERIRIARWNGEPPREPAPDTATVSRDDGTSVTGTVTGYDGPSKTFLIQTPAGEVRLPEDRIASLRFSTPRDEETQDVRAVLHDGTRLSGSGKRERRGPPPRAGRN